MKLYFGLRCSPELNDSALCYIAAYHDVWLVTGEGIIDREIARVILALRKNGGLPCRKERGLFRRLARHSPSR